MRTNDKKKIRDDRDMNIMDENEKSFTRLSETGSRIPPRGRTTCSSSPTAGSSVEVMSRKIGCKYPSVMSYYTLSRYSNYYDYSDGTNHEDDFDDWEYIRENLHKGI